MILHILLVKSEVPDEWNTEDDFSDIDDASRAPPLDDNDELNRAAPAGAMLTSTFSIFLCVMNNSSFC